MNQDRPDTNQQTAPGMPGNWDALSPPPRPVPATIRLRLIASELGFNAGGAFVFGAIAVLIGIVFVGAFDDVNPRSIGNPTVPLVLGTAVLLLGLCIWAGIAYVLLSRSRRVVRILSHGELMPARIARVFDRTTSKYRGYVQIVEEWARFQTATGSTQAMLGIARQFRNWRVKLLVDDPSGRSEEIDARLDLGPRMVGAVRDPQATLLVDRRGGGARCLDVDHLSWLGVSDAGDLTYAMSRDAEESGFGRSLLRSLLVVVPTYCLAAIGLRFGVAPVFGQGADNGIPPPLGAGVVLLFTLTHGVVPVFFYRIFAGALATAKQAPHRKPFVLFVSGFVHLHMGLWYGVPIVALAAMTGWLNLAWVAGHILFAGLGRRRWIFLEHGSTSMALLLFLVCFSGKSLFPTGILVVVFQALLLTLVDWKGRGLWVKESAGSS